MEGWDGERRGRDGMKDGKRKWTGEGSDGDGEREDEKGGEEKGVRRRGAKGGVKGKGRGRQGCNDE